MHAVDGLSEDEVPNTNRHEGQQCQNLDECKPELQLAEELNRDQVQGHGHNHHDEGGEPLRQVGKELVISPKPGDVDSNCGRIRHRCHGPVEPVQPAGDERRLFAVEFAGV